MSEQFEQKEEDRWEHREGEMQAERVFWNFLSAGVHQCGLKVSKKLEDKSALAWVSLDNATGVSLPQGTVNSGDDASVPGFELSGCRHEKALQRRDSGQLECGKHGSSRPCPSLP